MAVITNTTYYDYIGGKPWEFQGFSSTTGTYNSLYNTSIESEFFKYAEAMGEEYCRGNETLRRVIKGYILTMHKRKFYESYICKHWDEEDLKKAKMHREYIDSIRFFNKEARTFMIKSGFLAFLSIMVICAFFLVKTVYKTYDVSKTNEVKAYIEKVEVRNKLLEDELLTTKSEKEQLTQVLNEVHTKNKEFEETLIKLSESNKALEETVVKLQEEKMKLNFRMSKIEGNDISVPLKSGLNIEQPLILATVKSTIPEAIITNTDKKQEEAKPITPKQETVVKKEVVKEAPPVKVVKKEYVEYFILNDLYNNAKIKKSKVKLSNYAYAISGNKYNMSPDQIQLANDVLYTKGNVLPMHVFLSLIYTESKYNPNNVINYRFYGLAGTHTLLSSDYNKIVFKKPYKYQDKYQLDPHFNIIIAGSYLSDLIYSQKGDLIKAIALYYGEREGYKDKIKAINNYLVKHTGKSLEDYNKFSMKHFNDK